MIGIQQFLIILLHFTVIYDLELTSVCCFFTVKMLYSGVELHIPTRGSVISSLQLTTMGRVIPQKSANITNQAFI